MFSMNIKEMIQIIRVKRKRRRIRIQMQKMKQRKKGRLKKIKLMFLLLDRIFKIFHWKTKGWYTYLHCVIHFYFILMTIMFLLSRKIVC